MASDSRPHAGAPSAHHQISYDPRTAAQLQAPPGPGDGRVDTDRDEGVRTRRSFFERYCDTDTLCCTMHFPSPSVGHIKRWGDGFRLDYLK